MSCDKKLKSIKKSFDLPLDEVRKFIADFHSEMRKGLSGRKSSLKMIPTYVKKPKGTETGEFLALDLGGTNFRVLALKLKGNRKIQIRSAKKFTLEKKHITKTGEVLFDFIADCIKYFMDENEICIDAKHTIGFTFSFPMQKKSASSGILMGWTKGFRASGVVGKDVVKLLNEALGRKGLQNTKVAAIANDTVSTLVAKSYEDANCDVGVILGTGTNACYCEKDKTVINTEWGNFNKIRLTRYDKELDRASGNPGRQLLEKMISGMYLGEVVRLVIKNLFGKNIPFKAEYVSIIEADNSKNLSRINRLLKKLRVAGLKYADRICLKEICTIVSRRAARLAGAAIASLVTKMDPRLSERHTIAVDGSLYEKHPGFSKRMRASLKEIFGKKAVNIKLSLSKNASAKGAAIIAAAENQNKP